MPVRLQDIARELNLSAMTVSRVLNRPEGTYIAKETEERVLKAAAEMGYSPNRHARALATGRTLTIAVWISHLQSSAYTQIAKCCREEIEGTGLQASISALHWHFSAAEHHRQFDHSVDGILAVDPPEAAMLSRLLGETTLQTTPRVNLGSGRDVEWAGDYVRVDLCEGTRAAIQHLAESGCRRIAYSVPYGVNVPGAGNYDAYVEAMGAAGLMPEPIVHHQWDMPSVRSDVIAHIQEFGAPDGLYCHNDEFAIAAFRALRDMNLLVPGDVLLIGCEGNEFMEYFDPPLSTISMPIQKICRLAWKLLENRLENVQAPAEQSILSHQFLQRNSSRPNPDH